MIAACTSIAAAGPAAPAIAPARAGPSTNDTLRLDASIALAWSSNSGPTISAIALKKLAELNGRVTL